MLRQTSTLLALSLTALAMSGCGVFSHHSKKAAKKQAAAKAAAASHATKTAAKPSAVAKPSESAQEKKASEPAPKKSASTESGETATPPKSSTYPTGTLIPGKTGLVLSPYNNREVDVTGIASGKLVSDPTYPASEKKYFRVP